MKRTLFGFVILSMFLTACRQGPSSKLNDEGHTTGRSQEPISLINTEGKTIETRFLVPEGYQRTTSDSTSFASYLRNLPLKIHGSKVSYHDGSLKPNRNVYDAVVDMPIGKKDLHQCADAVMRLRAEYLYERSRYNDIHFNFTNGFRADYSKWVNGERIIVKGTEVYWKQKAEPSISYLSFWNYLEMVFSYAGTSSLSQELKSIPIDDLAVGDIFIQGGFPGHAVIVVDVALHKITEKKIFLLAQSYMPAQEIQILKNPNHPGISPWYAPILGKELRTPEWIFNTTNLKRFEN